MVEGEDLGGGEAGAVCGAAAEHREWELVLQLSFGCALHERPQRPARGMHTEGGDCMLAVITYRQEMAHA
eukprot:scaffold2891_cov13-Tisochrysis_lutea.AAC.1